MIANVAHTPGTSITLFSEYLLSVDKVHSSVFLRTAEERSRDMAFIPKQYWGNALWSPCFKFQLLQSGLLPGDYGFRCPHQNLLRMCGVRRIRLGVDCPYNRLAREQPEIGQFNIDSAGKPDVCLFTITTLQVARRLV
jgi:hypothetical protein